MNNAEIIILCALHHEFDALCNALQKVNNLNDINNKQAIGIINNIPVMIIETGIGATNTAMTTTKVIERYTPNILLFTGIAGAISPELAIGDVVISQMVFQAEADSHAKFAKHWPAPVVDMHTNFTLLKMIKSLNLIPTNYDIQTANLVSSETFPIPENLKETLEKKAAVAIDMESSAFYQVCQHYNIPCVSVRAISNHVSAADITENDIYLAANNAAEVSFNIAQFELSHQVKNNNDISYENSNIKNIIKKFNLIAHPEGGYYQRTFESNIKIKPQGLFGDATRLCSTAIFYLLAGNDHSTWHRIKSDEMWHFYDGSPLLIHYFDINNNLHTIKLGNPTKHNDAVCQFTVPSNSPFAAELENPIGYSFVGCTVSPGFDFADFEILDSAILCSKYPLYSERIEKLSRNKNKVDTL